MAKLEWTLSGKGISILDGGMGTELAAMGLEMGGQNCLSNPDAVLKVHQAYVAAGCDALITNTLTMNRTYLESHGMDVDVRAVNLAGARLARQAAGQLPVLGDISSTGQMLEPYGEMLPEACEANFREQAGILVEGGVDGFVVETFVDLNEALCGGSGVPGGGAETSRIGRRCRFRPRRRPSWATRRRRSAGTGGCRSVRGWGKLHQPVVG